MRIALYQPDIPQNTGNIFRIAACFGVDIDIIEPVGYIFDDKRFKRSSMDYMQYVNYKRHLDWDIFYKWTKDNNYNLILLTTKSNNKYYEYKFRKEFLYFLGSEEFCIRFRLLYII